MNAEELIEKIIEDYGSLLKGTLIKNLYDKADRWEECFNDVLLAVWNNPERFYEFSAAEKEGWLCAIAKYKAIDLLRKENNRSRNVMWIEDGWTAREIEQQYCTVNQFEADLDSAYELDKLLGCLSENDRALFVRKYVKEESADQIAKSTGMSKDNVYQRLSRGRKRIKSKWGVKYEK